MIQTNELFSSNLHYLPEKKKTKTKTKKPLKLLFVSVTLFLIFLKETESRERRSSCRVLILDSRFNHVATSYTFPFY